MKISKLLLVLALFLSGIFFAQEKDCLHEKNKKEIKEFHQKFDEINKKHQETFDKLSKEEKMKYFQKIKVDKILERLNLVEEKQKELKPLLDKYFEDTDGIMKAFNKLKKSSENLSNKEALEKLKESLDTAQKLLDNRKIYTEKFLEILTPQQVLEINNIEREMKDFFKKKHEHKKGKHKD